MLTRTPRLAILVLVLALAALGAGCAGVRTSATGASTGYTDLSAEEFRAMIDGGDPGQIVVLDVRTPTEFERERLRDAVNLDVSLGVFSDRVGRYDREKTYLVYCQSGTRSARAAQTMSELGFPKVYNLRGGIAKWKDAGYPVVTGA